MPDPIVSNHDSNDNSIGQVAATAERMTEDDYVRRSKALLGEVLDAEQAYRDLSYLYRTLSDDNAAYALLDRLLDAEDKLFNMPREWLKLAYDWVEANDCSAASVRGVFVDLEAFYLPSVYDRFETDMLMCLCRANCFEDEPNASCNHPGHAAILRHMPYAMYLRTSHWFIIRGDTLERAGNRCQVCNSPYRLHVHHRTYERRGAELPEDLIVLCRICHETFHKAGRLARGPTTPTLPSYSSSSAGRRAS